MQCTGTLHVPPPEAPPLLVARDARGVVTLTLNRPQAFNALSRGLLQALQQQLQALQHDDSARVVVLAAAGKAFCSGHDLRELHAQLDETQVRDTFDLCSRVMLGLVGLPQPVIARVQGMATAAGCQLVAQADLAVASKDAGFAVSGINLGLFCSTPSVALARNIPRKMAMEMLVTGEFIDPPTARQWGLINRVAEPDGLDAEVEALVAGILSKPAAAVALGKAQFYRQLEMDLTGAYELAAEAMTCNTLQADAVEGVRAFLDKRPAAWRQHG